MNLILNTLAIAFFPIIQPFLLILSNLSASGCFFIYKKLNQTEYETVDKRTFWRGPLRIYARLWKIFGRVYHGYEMIGMEKIPKQGPAILVIYHGTVPMDAGFILSKIYLDMDRKVVTVVDRMTQTIPGYKTFLEALEHSPGTIEWCVDTLKNGDLLAIYPGGTREAFLTDSYDVIWNDNAGFAKIALQTKAPIIPIFTQNVRESFLVLNLFREYFRKLYIEKKVGFALIYGWWPIKMRSFVGDPIQCKSTDSVVEVVRKSREGMEKLIREHQRIPNSVFMSLLDRI